MKSKAIYLALLISLAFNLGFLIMFAYHVSLRPGPLMPFPRVPNAKMIKKFDNPEMEALRNENMILRKDLFMELSKSVIDTTKINEIIINLQNSQNNIEHSVLQHFLMIRQEMTPEEAQEFFGIFQKNYEDREQKFKHKKESRRPQ